MRIKTLFFMIIVIYLSGSVLGATWVVGEVYDAYDGEPANDHVAILWNPAVGISDNTTDIIGPNGRSNRDNTFMINCDRLSAGCNFGDMVRVRVRDDGDGYTSHYENMTIGSGVNRMNESRLNSPPTFVNISVDDSINSPASEIDLTVGSTRKVMCEGVIYDYDGDYEIMNVSNEFFDNLSSFYGDSNDNNTHYTNESCSLDNSYGNDNESYFTCINEVYYNANPTNWNCTAIATSNFTDFTVSKIGSNLSLINILLGIGVDSPIDYGIVNANEVSNEVQTNVTNYGNTRINLTLEGFGRAYGDNLSMNCSIASTNISVGHEKFNLTASNSGPLDLGQFEGLYKNLSGNVTVNFFGLNYRQREDENEAFNSTYWRIYLPAGVAGNCSGNIVFGATSDPGY